MSIRLIRRSRGLVVRSGQFARICGRHSRIIAILSDRLDDDRQVPGANVPRLGAVPRVQRKRKPAPKGDSFTRLGAHLRELREAAGLPQAKLGAPHLNRPAVSRIELGQSAPSFKVMVHLARRLKMPVRDLIPPDL